MFQPKQKNCLNRRLTPDSPTEQRRNRVETLNEQPDDKDRLE